MLAGGTNNEPAHSPGLGLTAWLDHDNVEKALVDGPWTFSPVQAHPGILAIRQAASVQASGVANINFFVPSVQLLEVFLAWLANNSGC